MQPSFLSHADAALRNRNNILHFVKKYGPISRTEIWNRLNISRAAVTQVIRQLQESNLIVEIGAGESTGGRKPVYIAFNGSSRKFFAFDWVSRSLYLMDMGGSILAECPIQFGAGVTPVAFAALIEREITKIESLHLYEPEEMVGLGVALPGLIDHTRATVLYSVELGWQNVSLEDLFQHRFRNRVYLERTGNVMALGANAKEDAKSSMHLQLIILSHDGIGVSTVVRGDCQHGANYMYGELGHIKTSSDIICSCGQRGCLEAVVNSLLIQSGGVITDEILEYFSIGVSTSLNISDTGYAILVGSCVDAMTQEQKAKLSELIEQKLTGRHLRRLKLRYCHDMRQLSLDGICSNVFDRYFDVN